jgi:hypothetical protein
MKFGMESVRETVYREFNLDSYRSNIIPDLRITRIQVHTFSQRRLIIQKLLRQLKYRPTCQNSHLKHFSIFKEIQYV